MRVSLGTFVSSGSYTDSNGNVIFQKIPVKLPEIPPVPGYTPLVPADPCADYNCSTLQTYLTQSLITALAYNTSFPETGSKNDSEFRALIGGDLIDTGYADLGRSVYNEVLANWGIPPSVCSGENLLGLLLAGQTAVTGDPWRFFTDTETINGMGAAYIVSSTPPNTKWFAGGYNPGNDNVGWWPLNYQLMRGFGVLNDRLDPPNVSYGIVDLAIPVEIRFNDIDNVLDVRALAYGLENQNTSNPGSINRYITVGQIPWPVEAWNGFAVVSVFQKAVPEIVGPYERVPGDWWETIKYNYEWSFGISYRDALGSFVTHTLSASAVSWGGGTQQISVGPTPTSGRFYVDTYVTSKPGQFNFALYGFSSASFAGIYSSSNFINPEELLIAHERNFEAYQQPPECAGGDEGPGGIP